MTQRVMAWPGSVHFRAAVALAFFSAGSAAPAFESKEVAVARGVEVPVAVHRANGKELLIWLPSGFPMGAHEEKLADEMAAQGLEVWRANLLEGRFLPQSEGSLEEIPDADIVAVIREASRATGKRIYLAGLARSGLLALRGAHEYLNRESNGTALGGVVLLHPNLYLGPPEPGRDAEYHPAVAATRVPVYLIQPVNSPWRWRLETTQAELRKSGAAVFVRLIKEVRDRFYFRPDATEVEEKQARELAGEIAAAARLMAKSPLAPDARRALSPKAPPDETARVRQLRPYRGGATPPLHLARIDGGKIDLENYRGRVVLVNFWASWCPPCVHEMPSMQRLKQRLVGKPFDILAVNMAEDEATVRTFLREKVRIDFPILMDRDGEALKRWKIFVFPTSFVVGPDGNIAYALFGELAWDEPGVVATIEGLLRR